eukprot:1181901-Prorocentrum_minimum.AAC.5
MRTSQNQRPTPRSPKVKDILREAKEHLVNEHVTPLVLPEQRLRSISAYHNVPAYHTQSSVRKFRLLPALPGEPSMPSPSSHFPTTPGSPFAPPSPPVLRTPPRGSRHHHPPSPGLESEGRLGSARGHQRVGEPGVPTSPLMVRKVASAPDSQLVYARDGIYNLRMPLGFAASPR